MKIDNTKRIALKIVGIERERIIFSYFDSFMSTAISNNTVMPDNLELLRKFAVETENETEYSTEELMLRIVMMSAFRQKFDEASYSTVTYMAELSRNSKVFDVSEFQQNPYIKNIDFKDKQAGDYKFHYMDFMPFELFMYDTPSIMPDIFTAVSRIGCFTQKVSYPAISQISKDTTWMTVTPNEICTMKNAINHSFGKVLTLGCGLGYYTYMASLKDDVSSITVIEKEQDVIDLFSEYILPQFEHKEKVNIIRADAVEYLSSIQDGEYDYCFADIWKGVLDFVPYFAVKEIGRKFHKTKIDYWIEDSFCTYITNVIWIEILKTFSKHYGIDAPDDMPDDLYDDLQIRLEQYVHNLLKKEEIKSPNQIDYYMNQKNVEKLINKTKVIF